MATLSCRWPNKLSSISKLSQACSKGNNLRTSTIIKQPMRTIASKPEPLPVPDLQKTVQRFLRVSKPILSSADFKTTENVAREFLQHDGEGEKLQKLLVARAKQPEHADNWLNEWWWRAAYLEQRCPLPINIPNPGWLFPKLDFSGVDQQVKAAATLARSWIKFKAEIDACGRVVKFCGTNLVFSRIGEYDKDKMGNPLESNQYWFIFGSNRIPGEKVDKFRFGFEEKIKHKHVTVAHNGHLFKVDVFDENQEPLSVSQIEKQLKSVVEQSPDPNSHPVGLCTSQERPVWAKTYERLKANAQNAAAIEDLETAHFAICLDKTAPSDDITEHGRQLMHGGGTDSNSANRWFDKTLQLVVNTNGWSGLCYEHTPADGYPIVPLMDNAMDEYLDGSILKCSDASSSYTPPCKLEFMLTDEDKSDISAAGQRFDKAISDIDLQVTNFETFGKEAMKKAKMSPDTFCQLAIQLTFYRLHGYHPPTYQTALLRAYRSGRTETIRLPTPESADFVESMCTSGVPQSERVGLAHKAAQSHKEYFSAASTELAVDRHLLGLGFLARESGLAQPKLLQSPGYKRMLHFNLSTTQAPTKHLPSQVFPPMHPDCYSVCYCPRESITNLMTCTFKSGGMVSSTEFIEALGRSFIEMEKLLT